VWNEPGLGNEPLFARAEIYSLAPEEVAQVAVPPADTIFNCALPPLNCPQPLGYLASNSLVLQANLVRSAPPFTALR
jgi:hypothetical protein